MRILPALIVLLFPVTAVLAQDAPHAPAEATADPVSSSEVVDPIKWDQDTSTSDPTAPLPLPPEEAHEEAVKAATNAAYDRSKQQWIDIDPVTRRSIVDAWLSQPETTRAAFPNFWRQWIKNQKPLAAAEVVDKPATDKKKR